MEGDWITLALFLFFFIVLPLLQGIAQRRKGQQQDLPEADEEWHPEVEERAPHRPRRLEPEEWAAEWDDFPPPDDQRSRAKDESAWESLNLDDLFRGPQPEARPQPEPRLEPRPQPRPAPRPEPPPERWEPLPIPEPRPQPRPEPRVEVPIPVPVPVPHSAPRPTARPIPPQVVPRERAIERDAEREYLHRRHLPPAAALYRPHSTLLPDLRKPREIRRAIVLAEVLGQPRSLREHEK